MGKGDFNKHSDKKDLKSKKKNKNISKKDFDKLNRAKRASKLEKIKQRKSFREKELALKKIEKSKHKPEKKDKDDEEWEEVDEHEKDVFDKDGYFDVPDQQTIISTNDEKLLKVLQKKREESGKSKSKEPESVNLADLIMQKLQTGNFQDGATLKKELKYEDLEEGVASSLDPKVVAAYRSLGTILKSYKSGKLPKLFKIIPQVANWEELLFLTKPEAWSCVSTAEATKIFCSNLNSKMTQRFYNLVLLPNVRENISTYKKLNYHLYMAVKKALFKPAAFFKGFLLPLVEDCSSREAVIIGSILHKVSIPSIHSSAALIKLTEFDYNIGAGYFIKVLIGKRYALPTTALDMIVEFFCRFEEPSEEDGRIPEMPVMWHQTLLNFVQTYRHHLNESQRLKLKNLLKVQLHHQITAEIRKELFGQGSQANVIKNDNMEIE